ncbi:hypothetical protein M0R36_04565 [bacterium]|jgi:hypothetical protein|nr:hypothetical protein [bacterium]
MKKYALLFVFCLFFFHSAFSSANVLLNNSFETAGGNVGENWTQFGEAYRVAEGGAHPSAQDGSYMLLINTQGTGGDGNGAFQICNWTENTDYTFTGYYRIEAELPADYTTFLKVEYYNASETYISATEGVKMSALTDGWTFYELSGTTPANTASVRFVPIIWGTTSETLLNTVYWDNLSAVPEPGAMGLLIIPAYKKFKGKTV